MTLPKLSIAQHTLTLPVSQKEILFRQWTVGEEKILLIASHESSTKKDVFDAITQVLTACTLDKVDIKSLPISDVEYLIVKLRARSTDSKVSFGIKCKQCGTDSKQVADLSKLEPVQREKVSNRIELDGEVGVVLCSPVYSQVVEEEGDLIRGCVDCIYQGDNVFYLKDYSEEEIDSFFSQLTKDQVAKIRHYYDSLPRLEHEIEFDCLKCNHHNKYTMKGLADFFQL